MKQIFSLKKLPLLLLACGLVVTVAVAQSNAGNQKQTLIDTVPAKQKKIKDLDEALAEIDRGEVEMQRAMKEFDHAKMEAEIRKAMKNMNVDMANAKVEIEKAMKEIDMQKINLDVQKAMKEVDWEKIKKEVEESLSKVDMEKVKAELETAKLEMEKVKNVDLKKMQEELAAVGPEVEKAMKEAKADIEKARKEIISYRNLVNALDADGHLKKSDEYEVAYKKNVLIVNGKALSAEATRKYSEHLSGKKDFTLKKDEDGLNIDHD
jgi:chromosome segregation ATPase